MTPGWVRSSYSGSDNNDCVEVAAGAATVRVRDSKRPHAAWLAFGEAPWRQFVAYAADGARRR